MGEHEREYGRSTSPAPGRIALGGFLEVPVLVSRNFGQEPPGGNRTGLFGFNVATGRESIPMLDEQPLWFLRITQFRPDQNPGTVQLLPSKRKLQLAFAKTGFHIGVFGCPGALVPEHNGSAAILAFRNHALEVSIFQRVILHLSREALYRGIKRRTFGNGPRKKH